MFAEETYSLLAPSTNRSSGATNSHHQILGALPKRNELVADVKSTKLHQNELHQDENESAPFDIESSDSATNNDVRDKLQDISSWIRGGHLLIHAVETRKNLVMSLALFSTYFSVMGAKCALPSTFKLITSIDSGMTYSSDPQWMMSKVLVISTGAIALGKILLGPVIDKFGGVRSLKVSLSALMIFLAMIAKTGSFQVFSFCWILVDFVFSSCWAACLSSIHSSFQEDQWAGKVGLLAVAGRIGNALSFFAFASILQRAQNQAILSGTNVASSAWRSVFWLSSSLQIIPLTILAIYSRITAKENDQINSSGIENQEIHAMIQNTSDYRRPSIRDSLRMLMEESRLPAFWMHLIARSSLMIIASFLLFVPSYMSAGFGMSSADAARVAALYAIGSSVAVSFGAKKYSLLSAKNKIFAVGLMLGLLLGICILHLAHINDIICLSSVVGSISMLLWGLSFSIPFYIPGSMYALRRGGRMSSATIADAFDLVGFVILAGFNGFVASRKQDILMSWFQPFVMLTVFSITALVSLILSIPLEQNATP